MRHSLIRLAILLLISLSLVAVQAQETPIPQDPCHPLSNPPDAPANDSRTASIEHSALQMSAASEYDTALSLLDRLIDDEPDEAQAYLLRGCLAMRMGDERQAIEDWD